MHGMKRTSRKQVEKILDCLTFEQEGYKLITHEFCGKYKYSICRYSRKPDYIDHFGRVITWKEWNHEETLLHCVPLKKAYDFSCELLHKANFEC